MLTGGVGWSQTFKEIYGIFDPLLLLRVSYFVQWENKNKKREGFLLSQSETRSRSTDSRAPHKMGNILRKSAVQQSFVEWLTSSIAKVSSPCVEWLCFHFKLIIWWWQWPRRILTKRQIQRQRHTYTDKDKYKVLPRPNVCYIYQKQGVQGFKILYWLSSCDDKDKDKILCIIGAEYFSGVNIFQEWIFFSFPGVNIFQGWLFFRGEYVSGWMLFRG